MSKVSKELVVGVSRKTGVSEADVEKVLNSLGLNKVLSNVQASAGATKMSSLKVGDLKLGVRLGRSSVSV
ncbi:MAG: hypothetical protein WC829_00760 [Hyphomicrobium sp.]|jgi:hypothetical protein